MHYLDLTLPTPEENLACDEALLDAAEESGGGEILRFWEPCQIFVVVGYANHIRSEVRTAACEADAISILRRCSGGGTVLQAPGVLNYALILKITPDGPLRTINAANRFIMERNRSIIEKLIPETQRPQISVEGHTDLAKSGLKFSGNAQRRRKHFLLFHGSLLLKLDLSLVEKYLNMPSKQPAYRDSRSHQEFLTNLNLDASALKRGLRADWGATELVKTLPLETVASLARDKYATSAWNQKFP